MAEEKSRIQDVIRKNEKEILDEWVSLQTSSGTHRADLVSEKEVRQDSQTFLSTFIDAVQSGLSGQGKQWDEVRNVLAQLSRTRALKGFSPSETATFVFSLKQPLFSRLAADLSDPKAFAEAQKKKKPAEDGKIDKDAWKQYFDKRVVVTGLSDNARVEILKGLKAGEEVALEDPTLPNDKKKDDNDD